MDTISHWFGAGSPAKHTPGRKPAATLEEAGSPSSISSAGSSLHPSLPDNSVPGGSATSKPSSTIQLGSASGIPGLKLRQPKLAPSPAAAVAGPSTQKQASSRTITTATATSTTTNGAIASPAKPAVRKPLQMASSPRQPASALAKRKRDVAQDTSTSTSIPATVNVAPIAPMMSQISNPVAMAPFVPAPAAPAAPAASAAPHKQTVPEPVIDDVVNEDADNLTFKANEYLAFAVIAHRTRGPRTEYLVDWDPVWLPEAQAQQAVKDGQGRIFLRRISATGTKGKAAAGTKEALVLYYQTWEPRANVPAELVAEYLAEQGEAAPKQRKTNKKPGPKRRKTAVAAAPAAPAAAPKKPAAKKATPAPVARPKGKVTTRLPPRRGSRRTVG